MIRKPKNTPYGCNRLRLHPKGGYWCGATSIIDPSINCKTCKHESFSKKEMLKDE